MAPRSAHGGWSAVPILPRVGWEGGFRPNLEINLATSDAGTHDELREWFDKLWRDRKLTADVKQEVLDALARIGQEQAPEFIYFKTPV